MSLILKKNGKLYYTNSKNKTHDVTTDASEFLFDFIKIKEGVTLRKFLGLFNPPEIQLGKYLTNCYFTDLMLEAFREDCKVDSDMASINVGKNDIELHPDKYTFTSNIFKKKEKITIDPYTIGNDHFDVDGTGKDGVTYGIWCQSITHYMDVPLVLKPTFDIVEYRVIKSKKLKRNIKDIKKTIKVETQYRLIDILYAICWEMTFDGVITLEDEEKSKGGGEKTGHELIDTLKERAKETDKCSKQKTK